MNIMSGRKKIGFILIALLYACSGGSGSEDPELMPEPTPEPVRKEIKMLFGVQDIARESREQHAVCLQFFLDTGSDHILER